MDWLFVGPALAATVLDRVGATIGESIANASLTLADGYILIDDFANEVRKKRISSHSICP